MGKSKFRNWVIPGVCVGVLYIGIAWYLRVFEPRTKYPKVVITDHFDKILFVQGQQHSVDLIGNTTPVVAMVIPHHTVAAPILSAAWNRIHAVSPPCILLFGPNHLEVGKTPFLAAIREWETPFGVVFPVTRTEKLPDTVAQDAAGIAKDQSFAAQMPYLKTYLPDATVFPILVSRKAGKEEVETLARFLAGQKILDRCVAIASVDFSHDTPERERNALDMQTVSFLENGFYDTLLALPGTRVDSPASLVLLDMYIKNRNKKAQSGILYQSSSVLMLGEPPEYPSVGYVVYGYWK